MKEAYNKEILDQMDKTISQLERENNEYQQCNDRLTKELNNLLESNEKLLISFKDRYMQQ